MTNAEAVMVFELALDVARQTTRKHDGVLCPGCFRDQLGTAIIREFNVPLYRDSGTPSIFEAYRAITGQEMPREELIHG